MQMRDGGRKVMDNFQENKKVFYREIKKMKKGSFGKEEKVKEEMG